MKYFDTIKNHFDKLWKSSDRYTYIGVLNELESVWWQDVLIETISHLYANLPKPAIARQEKKRLPWIISIIIIDEKQKQDTNLIGVKQL